MIIFKFGGVSPVYCKPEEDEFSSAMASGFDSTGDDKRTVAPYAESQPADEPAATDADDSDDVDDTTGAEDDAVDDNTDADADDNTDADDELRDSGVVDDDNGDDEDADADDNAGSEDDGDDAAAQLKQQYPHLTADDIARAIREANRIEKEAADADAARAKAEEPPKAVTLDDFLTEEEKQILKTYDEEWGEVSKAEQIRTQALVKMALAEAKKEWGEALSPLVQTVQQSQQTSFRDTVLREHPDADQVVGNLKGWIEQQPGLTRRAYEQAYNEGTAEDIVELLSLYKQATGTGASQPPASTPTPRANQQQQQRQQKRQRAAQAAKATAAVTNSQRGDAPTAVDPDDFAAAFGEALKVV